MQPGLRLRQVRERLGLTYRDVERASYELAARRGRPDFILHISRLADTLSHCVPEAWRMPEEAEIIGRVAGVVTRLNEPGCIPRGESPTLSEDSR